MELELRAPKSDAQLIKDPYLVLGYGVNAYFDFLSYFAKMFVLITIFALPIYYTYGIKGWYFSGQRSYPISRWSLGNMGGISTFCDQIRVGKREVDIGCPPGTIYDTEDLHMGMIPSNMD